MGQKIFWDFIILLDSSHDSWKNEVLFVNIGARVLDLWLWIRLLGPSQPNEVPSPQAPRSINFLRFHIFTGFSSWFWRKWGLVCENWSQGSGLADGYVFWAQVGMSSHFFKLIFKTSQYHQMKAAEWQVSRMASFSSLTFTVLETRAFKVQKTRHFLRKISPLWNFKKWGQNLWVFKIGF